MDEACYVLNSDAYGRLKYKKMMQQFMEEVEKMLPMLQEHPIINEIALRMSFYAYRMDDYERCKKYYEEYRRIRLLGFNNLVLLKRFMCKDEASGNEKAHRKDWGFRWYRQVPLVLETLQRESRKKSRKYAISLKAIYRKLVQQSRN